MDRRHLAMTGLICVVLLSPVFISTSSEQGVGDYDPWCDLNDDGKIDIKDLANLARRYGTIGTPVNKTALLLELQSKVDSLNASLVEQEARVDGLEKPGYLSAPAYDSGWMDISQDITIFEHNLNTTEVVVYVVGKDPVRGIVHHEFYGAYIDKYQLDNQTKQVQRGLLWGIANNWGWVHRLADDNSWLAVRIRMWRIREPST